MRHAYRLIILPLAVLMVSALLGAATGYETDPQNPSGLPLCKHALGTPGAPLALAAEDQAAPQAEATCTNPPKEPEPSGEETTHKAEPSESHKPTPKPTYGPTRRSRPPSWTFQISFAGQGIVIMVRTIGSVKSTPQRINRTPFEQTFPGPADGPVSMTISPGVPSQSGHITCTLLLNDYNEGKKRQVMDSQTQAPASKSVTCMYPRPTDVPSATTH